MNTNIPSDCIHGFLASEIIRQTRAPRHTQPGLYAPRRLNQDAIASDQDKSCIPPHVPKPRGGQYGLLEENQGVLARQMTAQVEFQQVIHKRNRPGMQRQKHLLFLQD